MHLFWKNNFGCLLVGVLMLLLAQPNLSTASLIAIVTLVMMMAGGMKPSTIAILLVIAGRDSMFWHAISSRIAGSASPRFLNPGGWGAR